MTYAATAPSGGEEQHYGAGGLASLYEKRVSTPHPTLPPDARELRGGATADASAHRGSTSEDASPSEPPREAATSRTHRDLVNAYLAGSSPDSEDTSAALGTARSTRDRDTGGAGGSARSRSRSPHAAHPPRPTSPPRTKSFDDRRQSSRRGRVGECTPVAHPLTENNAGARETQQRSTRDEHPRGIRHSPTTAITAVQQARDGPENRRV